RVACATARSPRNATRSRASSIAPLLRERRDGGEDEDDPEQDEREGERAPELALARLEGDRGREDPRVALHVAADHLRRADLADHRAESGDDRAEDEQPRFADEEPRRLPTVRAERHELHPEQRVDALERDRGEPDD